MKKISVLPSLVTLGNLLCGFGAILCLSPEASLVQTTTGFELAALLIFIAMVFDGLDGTIARATHMTTDFGKELDSLCDIVSFGVAPAVLAHAVVMHNTEALAIPPQAVWLFSALFAVGAALRLARFNVETAPEAEAHDHFKGLPSPAAAGLVAGLVVVSRCFDSDVVTMLLPLAVLAGGTLMVSNIRYVHVLNRIFRGQKPFRYLVKLVFLLLIITILNWRLTLGCTFIAYALTGPVAMLEEHLRARRQRAVEKKATT